MNRKVNDVLDRGTPSDVLEYFEQMESILEANSGVNDNKTLTVDSSDPPCPIQHGLYTKVKLTDDAIHITNIDKSSLTIRVRLDIVSTDDFWESILEEEPNMEGDMDSESFSKENADTENDRRKNYAFAKTYRNKIIKWFVGFKASIHCIESYRVYSSNMKTACEQSEALYENAVSRMLKPQEELDAKPGIYTTYKHAGVGDDCVCGTYFTLEDLINKRKDKKLQVEFDCAIPLDDFLPFSAFTLYPNKIFENLSMEIKMGILQNIVICQVDPVVEFERLMKTTIGGSPGAETALLNHLRNDIAPIGRKFTQMGDPFISTLYKINQNGTLENVSCLSHFRCTRGDFLSVRTLINGFNVKDSVLKKLKAKFSNKPLIVPAQYCDYQAFSQTPQGTGVKCNTTYGMTNVSSLMFVFPRTDNELTCCSNPHFSSIQVTVDNKPYPDKNFSTFEPAHTIYNLTNAGLDSLFSPSEEYAYSLVYNEVQDPTTIAFKGVSTHNGVEDIKDTVAEYVKKVRAPYKDNTSYVFVVATERLGGYGNFCDGITKDNAHIGLTASLWGASDINPYYTHPLSHNEACDIQVPKNTRAPIMVVCQDAFWVLRPSEPAMFVCNDRKFYDIMTEREEALEEDIPQPPPTNRGRQANYDRSQRSYWQNDDDYPPERRYRNKGYY